MSGRPGPADAPPGGLSGASRAERRKLLAQPSTRVLALVCLLGPFAFAAVLSGQSGVPGDTLLGAGVHSSGYTFSLVVLGFAGYLGLPVLGGVLAGDIFSAEDRYGTWKTILTRSRSRGELFAGKILAAMALALALLAIAAASSLISGFIFIGDQPMVGLGGNVIGSGQALWLVLASWLVSAPALLGFTSLALLLSAASRSGIVGVIGPVLAALVMQLLALVGTGSWMHTALLAASFDAWHGLLGSPRFYLPLAIGIGVALLWILACIAGAWGVLRRRDFAGPAVPRRPGWGPAARVVLSAAAVTILLGLLADAGPTAITAARLEASVKPVFGRLLVLQQQELGRTVSTATQPRLRTSCRRHSGQSAGPGDDWTCTLTVVAPSAGAEPFQITSVIYDLSVKSNGCYRAEAPPTFVGQQMMSDAAGHSIINPLFIFYGCFDTTASAAARDRSAAGQRPSTSGRGSGTTGVQSRALREAEQSAGPGVVRETEASERAIERQAEGAHPAEEASKLNLGR